MKTWKLASELTQEDKEHLAIVEELDRLDRWQPRVALSFIAFWILLGCAFIVWGYYYIFLPIQGWFS
jgi:hypothetical protein